ncbi:hypothetical protein F0562_025123 [Nyssa sinensis]|uniref:Uncharacterized protein n=1 Tax=Nyssa sinensis TaxID=561372 RepID=A0A5J5BJ15_9ASTE|nr:hypothetical protein F0562_025123 [Nyssa sinensis]
MVLPKAALRTKASRSNLDPRFSKFVDLIKTDSSLVQKLLEVMMVVDGEALCSLMAKGLVMKLGFLTKDGSGVLMVVLAATNGGGSGLQEDYMAVEKRTPECLVGAAVAAVARLVAVVGIAVVSGDDRGND